MRKFRDHEKIDLEILINLYVLRTSLLSREYEKKVVFGMPSLCLYVRIHVRLASSCQLIEF
jgi:hypothetical protein